MFDAQRFCSDHMIRWFPPGSKNVGQGFIGIRCPMCNDHSSHGGFHIKKSYYNCHRCGGHWLPKIISILAKVNIYQAKEIITKYSSDEVIYLAQKKKISPAKEVIFPPDSGPLTEKARQYLISRNFDPFYLASEWGILSAGNVGEYKFSIIAPIYFNNTLVSYQCRDTTGKWRGSYKACEPEESIMNIKHTLYGFDNAVLNKKCLVDEGITDNWRMGPGAVATYGIEFTIQQVMLLAKNFDEIFIMYDPEDQAQEQADKLYYQLRGFDKKVEILGCPAKDPAELTDDEAKYIMKSIGF